MKSASIVLMTILTVAASAAQTVVHGKVTGIGGTPMPAADVVLCRLPDFIPDKSAPAGKDGQYRITIPSSGLWMLRFTGALHRDEMIALYPASRDSIGLDVELGTYRYLESFDGVKAIGTFNNWGILTAESLRKQADSTYVAEVPSSTDSVEYQLMYVRKGNVIEGTDAGRYIPDPAGHYRAVVAVRNGTARVVFDPRKLEPPGHDARIVFRGSESVTSEFARIDDEYRHAREQYSEAFQNTVRSRKGLQNFSYDWSRTEAGIRNRLKKEKESIIREELMLELLSIHVTEKRSDTALYRSALKEIPPSSIVWLLSPHDIYQALNRAGLSQTERDEYVRRFMSENPSTRVVAALLFDEYHVAKYSGDEMKAARYYDYVTTRIPDSPEAAALRKGSPHELDVRVGRPAPDFTVVFVSDTSGVLTRNSFANKYLLLDFCSASDKDFPRQRRQLVSIHKKYRDKNFQILSLFLDTLSARSPASAKATSGIPWPVVRLTKGIEDETALGYHVVTLPSLFLIGPDGTLLAKGTDLRGEKLEATLKQYLEGR